MLFRSEKVFPKILKAFGITDFELLLPTPEEKAEATRISFAQQRVGIANQLAQMGFEIKLKEDNIGLEDAEFVVTGEMAKTVQMQAQGQELQLEQQMQQAEQQASQTEEQGGSEEGGGEDIQAMEKSIPASERKFKGRTGGRTPDWHDKAPNEERDIDEWADKRKEKAENRAWGLDLSKTWVQSLNDQGFTAPTIREVSPDGSQMWFIEKGVDYVADLSSNGLGEIKKATFIVPFPNQSPTNPTVSYDPSGSNQRKDPNDDVDDDNEDE